METLGYLQINLRRLRQGIRSVTVVAASFDLQSILQLSYITITMGQICYHWMVETDETRLLPS